MLFLYARYIVFFYVVRVQVCVVWGDGGKSAGVLAYIRTYNTVHVM